MSVVECRKCRREISLEASICPHCGEPAAEDSGTESRLVRLIRYNQVMTANAMCVGAIAGLVGGIAGLVYAHAAGFITRDQEGVLQLFLLLWFGGLLGGGGGFVIGFFGAFIYQLFRPPALPPLPAHAPETLDSPENRAESKPATLTTTTTISFQLGAGGLLAWAIVSMGLFWWFSAEIFAGGHLLWSMALSAIIVLVPGIIIALIPGMLGRDRAEPPGSGDGQSQPS